MRHYTKLLLCPLLIATLLQFSSFVFSAATTHAAEAAPKKKAKKADTEDRGLAVVEKNRATGKRIALVIGNGSYRHTDSMPKLANPPNDADDMATALRRFGFEVVAKKNLTKEEMDEAITDFGRKIADSDAALFYYAGHGLQVKGQNYMVPVDANIDSEAKVPYRAVNVNLLLDEMDSSRSWVNIVMLDACRNNPISGKFRSGSSRGLAPPSTMPKGTVVVYATDPGNVAADGSGRNGLFTAGLLTAFRGSDLTLAGVLTRASEEVERNSNQQQTPYINGPATVQKRFAFNMTSPSSMTDLQPSEYRPEPLKPVPVAEPAKKFKLNPIVVEEPPPTPVEPRPLPSVPVAEPRYVPPTPKPPAVAEIEMINVPGGCFQMGDTFGDGFASEKPLHEACVNDFAIGKYEVTQGQWRKVMGNNPSNFSSCGDDCPVEQVSWNDVQEFVRKLNSQTGKRYRLPTEAEWEYAARSGGKQEKYSGGDYVDDVAWYKDNSGGKTHPVGQKRANGLGIHDMSGNVWEWVSDRYGDYSSGRQQNPQGPSSGSSRVNRGGSWGDDARYVRAASRSDFSPDVRRSYLGFRLASPVQ
jgi:formylglycine-generating enzyme required for sulfatase activity